MIDSPSFLRFLRSAPMMSDAEVERALEHFQIVEVKAKEYIVSEGEICKRIGYVNKGCFSYFKLLATGKKSIIHFAFEDWWTGDLQSFLNRQPATTYWQAIENSELICVTRSDFDKLCADSPGFKYLFDLKTQRGYMKAMENAAKDKSETAEEKYMRLIHNYPQILQRVPHYDIASYLGIAPESLSRIRNKVAQQK